MTGYSKLMGLSVASMMSLRSETFAPFVFAPGSPRSPRSRSPRYRVLVSSFSDLSVFGRASPWPAMPSLHHPSVHIVHRLSRICSFQIYLSHQICRFSLFTFFS